MDKKITCVECGSTFTFTEGEQKFYAARDYAPPKRCQKCRSKRKAEKSSDNGISTYKGRDSYKGKSHF